MKSFLKQIAASFFGSCFSLTVFAVAVFIGTSAAIGLFVAAVADKIDFEKTARGAGTAAGNSVLVIDLSRGFSDSPTFSPANTPGAFSSQKGRYGLLDTIRALECAQADESVAAVLLLGGNAGGGNGFATICEVRDALRNFRERGGKPVFAYLPNPTLGDYLLATAADEIWLHPFAELPLNGIASSGIYFKSALEKIGVGVQITRVGTHKSAVEPLIADAMSPEDREQRTRLANGLWAQILFHVAAARAENAGEDESKRLVQNFIEEIGALGLIPAETAVEKNFVDRAIYDDEMIELLKEIAGTDAETNSFRQIAADDYMRSRGIAAEPPLDSGNPLLDAFANRSDAAAGAEFSDAPLTACDSPCLAVVYAEGEIVDGAGTAQEVGGQWFSRALRDLRNDDSVRAVVLRVNSPGGSVFASEQIRREAELLARKKTLVVSMGDVAASGGYWISVPAKKVFANPMTVTGSIGVFGVIFNLENLGKKIGVSSDAVLTAPFAEIDTLRRPKTPEEMAVFQKATDRIYEKFLRLVADARGMKPEDVDKIAQGQVWLGVPAKEKNLVDEFGGLVAAIRFAREDAGLDEDTEIISVPGEVNRFQDLLDMFDDSTAPVASAGTPLADAAARGNPALRDALKRLEKLAARLRAFNDPNGIYARLPFEVEKN